MNTKAGESLRSSLLTSPLLLGVLAASAIFCKMMEKDLACLFFTAYVLLFGISRLWAVFSVRHVSFTCEADRTALFPGQDLNLKLTLTNQKTLPLLWAEMLLTFSSTDCIRPAEGNDGTLQGEEAHYEGVEAELLYRRRAAFVLGGQQVSAEGSFTALHRGIYHAGNILLRSGDALGLAQKELPVKADGVDTFAVYPALQAVNTGMFTRSTWAARCAGRGYTQDPTLLKSTRPYLPGDSARQINWRLAAMGLGLQTNIQETLLPVTAHFILDGDSYGGPDARPDWLEDVLSVLASLVTQLEAAGIRCGLSLPAGPEAAPITLPAFEGHGVSALLFAMAAYQPNPPERGEDGKIRPPAPARFQQRTLAAAAAGGERLYWVTRSPDRLPAKAMRRVYDSCAALLCSTGEDAPCTLPAVSLSSIKKGGGV